jgi:hypothetical protein
MLISHSLNRAQKCSGVKVTFTVPCQPSFSPLPTFLQSPANLPQSPANLPSDRLWLRVSYCPGWQAISPLPPWVPGGVQYGGERPAEACSMATSPHQPATWGQERGTVSSSSNSTSTPTFQTGQQVACPSSCHHSVCNIQYMCGEGHCS